jgi:chaperonin GroES
MDEIRNDGLLMDQPMLDEPDALEGEDPQVSPEQFVEYVTQSRNLVPDMDEGQAKEISQQVLRDYEADKGSGAEWKEQMDRGIKLAKMVKEDRNYPYPGSANIMYPMVTTAALQFNARAYQALVPPGEIVKVKVRGNDEGGKKAARAQRVSEHMSDQLRNDIPEWEEGTDQMLVVLPIVGEAQRKWWYDAEEGRPKCRLVDPGKFIVNNKAQSMRSAPRCSEEIPLYPFEVESRIRSETFVQFEYSKVSDDAQDPVEFIEQHMRFDLDDDGYPEPYIATVHADGQQLVRLVADFQPEDVRYVTEQQQVMAPVMDQAGQPMLDMMGQPSQQATVEDVPVRIKSIRRGTYYVNFKFLPSMDGGVHGTGLGFLLGDMSETVNTTFNMLLDSGHYASLGGGFIGSELRLKGGGQRMRPGEFKTVGSTGQDVRSAIVPMTYPGPNAVLFQMLGMMIEAGKEVASVKDIMTGDTGSKNMTATTTIALIEQGMMMSNAIFKRLFRAFAEEFKLLARINSETLEEDRYAAFHDAMDEVSAEQDYNLADMDIEPIADPRSVTKMQEAGKAQLLMQLAEGGLVDKAAAVTRLLEAMQIDDVEELIPQPDPQAAMLTEMQMDTAQAEVVQARANIELTLAKVESERAKTVKDLTDAEAAEKNAYFAGLKLMLEEERGRLETAIGKSRGMAGPPNDGAAKGPNGSPSGPGGAPNVPSMVGGQPPIGGGAAGLPPGAEGMGGLF